MAHGSKYAQLVHSTGPQGTSEKIVVCVCDVSQLVHSTGPQGHRARASKLLCVCVMCRSWCVAHGSKYAHGHL